LFYLFPTGLGAARWLVDNAIQSNKQESLEVIVLEARNRIGGRVFTSASGLSDTNKPLETSDVDKKYKISMGLFDMGASWIHDPDTNPLTIMASSMQLKTTETDFDEMIYTNLQGKRYSDKDTDKPYQRFERELFKSASEARSLQMFESSLEDLLVSKFDMHNCLLQSFLSMYEFELGTELKNTSACECIDGDWIEAVEGVGESNCTYSNEDTDDLLLPHGGFIQLLEGLVTGAATRNTTMEPTFSGSAGTGPCPGAGVGVGNSSCATEARHLNVLLNQEVVSIDYREDAEIEEGSRGKKVLVAVKDSADLPAFQGIREYEADAVVLTVPLGVLKRGSIAFTPPLSAAKQDAIARVGFGNVVKVVMEFPKVFWPTHASYLSIADPSLGSAAQRGLLTGFLNGHLASGGKHKVLVGYGLGAGADAIDQVPLTPHLTLPPSLATSYLLLFMRTC
jgi:monoamine oxidase